MVVYEWITGVIVPYAPYINFFLFVYLLWRSAKGPAHDAAQKRSEEYRSLYEKASESNREARASLEALRTKMSSLEGEIAGIESQAQQTAKAYAESLAAEAERMSEHLSTEAQQLAVREAVHAKELLKEELWGKAKEDLLERVRLEFTVKKQKEYLWDSLSEVKNLEK